MRTPLAIAATTLVAMTGVSLLTGSTYPGRKPADIMGWCTGYGDKETLSEWLRPSEWLAKQGAR